MEQLQRHHHFRSDQVTPADRVAQLEMLVVDELLRTKISDERRDSSIAWELKHQAGVTQFGRLLAEKRGLNPDIAAVGALLHDIYTVVTGSYEDHARRGGPIALELLKSVGGFDLADQTAVNSVVVNHSDKHVFSDDVWAEFGKDVDVLDCLLYPHALDEYLLAKPLERVKYYLARAKSVWIELGVPPHASFSQLDDYSEDRWLSECKLLTSREATILLASAPEFPFLRPFALVRIADSIAVSYVSGAAEQMSEVLSSKAAVDLSEITSSLPSITDEQIVVVWPAISRYQLIDVGYIADSVDDRRANISLRPTGRFDEP